MLFSPGKIYNYTLKITEKENIPGKPGKERTGMQVGRWVGKGLVEGLVEKQEKIIKLIHNDPQISKKKMAEIVGISSTAVDKNIDTLKKQGILKRIGPDKGGHWEIMNGKLNASLSEINKKHGKNLEKLAK